ncbi:reverse transcriptase domain-containing protein [Tanacetum coccineum]|uniref:Reverse transcriptase domain-containing protein n=1 Tax=Tanacetum coccineum TaxID=301880 RepID=A0ABQ5DB43_9ASTR
MLMNLKDIVRALRLDKKNKLCSSPDLSTQIGSEAITYNLDQTSRYSANYTHMTANKIDVIDMACEEYSQEVLGFTDIIASGNSTPKPGSFLGLADDQDVQHIIIRYDPEGDILILEAILNSEPPLPPPSQGTYLPEIRTELKVCETNTANSSVDEPTEVELKELPPHLEPTSKKSKIQKSIDDIKKEVDKTSGSLDDLPLSPTVPGLARRFILDFSKISDNDPSLEKNTPFIFSDNCIRAFQTLKDRLTEAPILIAPNWDLPFELMCDASDFAIGAVLGQRHEKHFRPIHYASLTHHEQSHSAYGPIPPLSISLQKRMPGEILRNMGVTHVSPPLITTNKWASGSIKSWIEKESLKGTIGEKPCSACHLPIELEHKALLALMQHTSIPDCPDCEDSQFCHSSRVSHPQLHLGIRYPNLID